jgi:hypothetical protein
MSSKICLLDRSHIVNHPLEQRWAVTREYLAEVYALLQSLGLGAQSESCFAQYQDALEHNELELALDSLDQVTEFCSTPSDVWERFAVAAASMDLSDRAYAYRKMANTQT